MSITLLCEIIAQRSRALAATYRGQAGYDALTRAALVRESGVVQSFVCDACEGLHDAEVVFEDGQYGHFCPDLGFVALRRDQIAGVEADLGKLVDALACTFNCKRRNSKPIHGATWRIGVIETDQGGVAIYFNPQLQDVTDLRDFESALRREVGSRFTLVLTAYGSLVAAGCKSVNLADIIDLDPASSALIVISDLPAIAGVRPARSGGAPNRFEQKSFELLAMRERRGLSLTGRNEEAAALLQTFRAQFPADDPPSLPTVKRYVTKFRAGS